MDLNDASARRALITGISSGRFRRYLVDVGGDEREALRLYFWNMAVSASVYGPIQVLEVSLRNAIHRELSRDHGDDWWDRWDINLDWRGLQQVDHVRNRMEKQKKIVTAPGIVAQLSFGFWTKLLSPGHKNRYEMAFWRKSLNRAFPHARTDTRLKRFSRAQIYGPVERINAFRNRVAHHMAVYNEPLGAHVDTIEQICGWIDPTLPALVRHIDTTRPLLAHLTKPAPGRVAVDSSYIP